MAALACGVLMPMLPCGVAAAWLLSSCMPVAKYMPAGVLLIAKSPDAAASLSAAFRDDGSSSWGISKTYWAVVAREGSSRDYSSSTTTSTSSRTSKQRSGGHGGWLPPSGTVNLPVPSSRDPEQLQPAHTAFRVLQQSESLAWLELRPTVSRERLKLSYVFTLDRIQPVPLVNIFSCPCACWRGASLSHRPIHSHPATPAPQTGRKHQLRRHCAELGAPILGDERYGALRSPAHAAALADLQQLSGSGRGSGSGPPLLLHCRQLELKRPAGGKGSAPLRVEAPLPATWRTLLQRQGWPLPRGEQQ